MEEPIPQWIIWMPQVFLTAWVPAITTHQPRITTFTLADRALKVNRGQAGLTIQRMIIIIRSSVPQVMTLLSSTCNTTQALLNWIGLMHC